MVLSPSTISKGPNNTIKIEYIKNGEPVIKMWETSKDGKISETTFKNNGSITDQAYVNVKDVREHVESFIRNENLEPSKTNFEEIKLDRKCPKCSGNIDRYAKDKSVGEDIPIMPLYVCKECNSKSYHLTIEYLHKLVNSNLEMFSDSDKELYKENSESFIKELKEYINRIFASKHIPEIK